MIGADFIYCDNRLSDFGFVMAKPDTDDSNGLTREILKGTVTSQKKEAIHYGAKYSDVIKLNFFIVKNPCINLHFGISDYEFRKIQSWLTSVFLPHSLVVEFEDGTQIQYIGLFTEITPYYYNGLNGFNLVFTCNSSFAYEEHRLQINAVGSYGLGTKTKEIFCDTDENDYVYPTIIFSGINENGYYEIINETDNSSMLLYLNKKYSNYIIDGKLKRILADGSPVSLEDIKWNIKSITDYNNVNTGIFKTYWLRLRPNINVLTFNGNADCLIEYKAPIKLLGGYIYV